MKSTICVRVDMEVWADFRNFVMLKHGKLHTALGAEVTEALRAYLARKKNRRTHTSNPAPDPLLARLENEILKYVAPGGSLSKHMLAEMIVRVAGINDHRAINNKIRALLASGFIRRDIPGVFRVVIGKGWGSTHSSSPDPSPPLPPTPKNRQLGAMFTCPKCDYERVPRQDIEAREKSKEKVQ